MGSNPLCSAGVKDIWSTMRAQEATQKAQTHRLDRLKQTIADLAQLMRGANRDHEEVRKLPVDLPQSTHNPKPIPEFDQIPLKDEKFSKKIFINWLTKVKAYFYFNKIICYKKYGLLYTKFLVVPENSGMKFQNIELVWLSL